MARPRRTTSSAMLNLRVDHDVKERLLAAAYHDLASSEGLTSVEDVNLSEFLRSSVLEKWLDMYESQAGGAAALADEYSRARLASLEESLAQLRESSHKI